jgi:hypothetical protein
MKDASRRGFLVMTGAGAAAVATAGVVVIAEKNNQDEGAVAHNGSGPMVAWIGDVSKHEITIMVGEREVVVNDADLVAKLVRATGQE